MNYFIQVEGESQGPLVIEQIWSLLADQSLQKSDLVRREDSAEWMPISSMTEFTETAPHQSARNNPLAVASLVLGIVSVGLLFSGWMLFFLTAVLAIILGHLATRKIRRTLGPVKGRGMARAGLTLGYFGVLAGFAIPVYSTTSEKYNITTAIGNCRQIITTLRLYSSDSSEVYPDKDVPNARTSNEAFHELFVMGAADNEQIFGSPISPFIPDGNIGVKPDFLEALKPGENHWAMTKGLNDSASGSYPLVYENPAEATWPPKWNADFASQPKPGRAWIGGKIIIGMNDSSVSLQPLESDKGDRVGLKPFENGKNLFTQNKGTLEILNVAQP